MIYTSRFPDLTVEDTDVFTHLFSGLGGADAARPALTELTTGATITYGELRERAEAFAGALSHLGVARGDVVALQLPNSIDFAVALLGIARAGAAVAPVGTLLNTTDVQHLVDASRAKLFIGDTDVAGCPRIRRGEVDGLVGKRLPAPAGSPGGGELFALPFSSGTTGLPKGVRLTHRNIVANIEQTSFMLRRNGVTRPTTMLCPLPFSHIYGLTTLLLSQLTRRHHLFTLPKFDFTAFVAAHAAHRIEFTFIAPPIAVALAKDPSTTREAFRDTRILLSGAAPLDNDLARAVETKLGVTMLQGYGLTETSPVTHMGILGVDEPGAIGSVVPNTSFRILALDSDADVAEGDAGELAIRGPQVTAGYLGDPGAAGGAFVEGGWLRTGDVARVVDGDGVFIVDRAKDVIKYKGYQVAPAELEALLLTHPDVADVGVVGVERGGLEIPRAFVVARAGATVGADELMEWVAQRVTPYKKVRDVRFVEAIPTNPAGKILRRTLRALP